MMCPIFPAVHHRPAEVHWRGFTFLDRIASFVLALAAMSNTLYG